jgi:hypothetical protein
MNREMHGFIKKRSDIYSPVERLSAFQVGLLHVVRGITAMKTQQFEPSERKIQENLFNRRTF